MTKYILNSGGVGNNKEKAATFFNEIIKDFGPSPKILLCFFAVPRENWETKYREDVDEIPALLHRNIQPAFELAFPDTFEQQVKESDAVYIHGGDDHLLQYWLRHFELPKMWEGKTIATNSASSHALSQYFWTCDWRQCMEGLGLLPIKFLAHYKSSYGSSDIRGKIDWEKAYRELERFGDKSLPIYALEEGDYKIFTV